MKEMEEIKTLLKDVDRLAEILGIPRETALQLLTLYELRCIHAHKDLEHRVHEKLRGEAK